MNQISKGKIVKFGREAKILFIRLKKKRSTTLILMAYDFSSKRIRIQH